MHGHHHAPSSGDQPGYHRRFDDPAQWAQRFESPSATCGSGPTSWSPRSPSLPTRAWPTRAGTGIVRLARAVPQGGRGPSTRPTMVRWVLDRARRDQIANLTAVLASPDDARRCPSPLTSRRSVISITTSRRARRTSPGCAARCARAGAWRSSTSSSTRRRVRPSRCASLRRRCAPRWRPRATPSRDRSTRSPGSTCWSSAPRSDRRPATVRRAHPVAAHPRRNVTAAASAVVALLGGSAVARSLL